MPFRQKYIQLENPCWPPTSVRANVIYNSIARTISNATSDSKNCVFNNMQQLAADFDSSCFSYLGSQATYDKWHSQWVHNLTQIPFSWNDKNGSSHHYLTLGIAQKLLNLSIKDWWALAPNAQQVNHGLECLHAPMDRVVYTATSRFICPLNSLIGKYGMKSYLYNVTCMDYLIYQQHLAQLAGGLSKALNLSKPLLRIEIDQLLWGWV